MTMFCLCAALLLSLIPISSVQAACAGNPIRIASEVGANYTTVSGAYTASSAAGTSEIRMAGGQIYSEPSILFGSKAVQLTGGWDCSQTVVSYASSEIQGTLTISGAGSVNISRISLSTAPPSSPPAAPTNLSVTPVAKSSSSLQLSWGDNSNNETGFKVQRSTNSTTGFVEVSSLGAGVASWTDTGRSACTPYYYRVYAYNVLGNSAYASGNATTAPAAPVGMLASRGLPLLGIYLDWTATACAAQYRIYECNNAGYVYADKGTVANNLADMVDVAPNIYLFYRVAGVDVSGHEGSLSCAVDANASWAGATGPSDTCYAAVGWAASPMPNGAWASAGNYVNQLVVGWNPVQLTWNYLNSGTNTYASLYNMWYSENRNNASTYETMTWTQLPDIAASPSSATPITVTKTPISINWWTHYKISPSDYPTYPTYASGWAAPNGGASNVPGTPLITAGEYYPGLIMVGWSSITGAIYNVQRSSTSGSSGFSTIRTGVSYTSFNDTAVTCGTTPYWYRVQAVIGGVAGAWSASEMGTCITLLP
ncbi:MAG: hypothetical protein C0402_14630 [Thermodesulfovibrio sp.]|nr:hypothetical protein [Thermodesulfovibrio sp.]